MGDADFVTDGPTGETPRSITIPTDAVLGTTVMRVSTKFKDDGLPSFCENGFDGEVEDYALSIMPTLSVETFGFENFAEKPPNPARESVRYSICL